MVAIEKMVPQGVPVSVPYIFKIRPVGIGVILHPAGDGSSITFVIALYVWFISRVHTSARWA